MASWQDNLIAAKFRGASFKIRGASMTGGRRIITHIFPERDEGLNEDRGLKQKTFTIDAHVLGDDYFKQREELIKALDAGGAGTLHHPYRGKIQCVVDNYNVTETFTEGRLAVFSITFIRDKDKKLTVILPGADVAMYAAKQSFFDKLLGFLEDVYNIASYPTAVLQDVINGMNQVLAVGLAAKKITGTFDEFVSAIDVMKGQLLQSVLIATAIGNDIKDMVTFGTDPFSIISGAIASDPDMAAEQFSEMNTMMDVQNQNFTKYPSYAESKPDYPMGDLKKLTSRFALGSAAGLLPTMRIDNVNSADGLREDLFRVIETIEDDTRMNDELLSSTLDLKVAIDNVIDDRKLSLNRVFAINMPEFEPAANLAYEYLGDAERDLEITTMNEILHPGFVPGAEELKIQIE